MAAPWQIDDVLLKVTTHRNLGDSILDVLADVRGGATWLCQAELKP